MENNKKDNNSWGDYDCDADDDRHPLLKSENWFMLVVCLMLASEKLVSTIKKPFLKNKPEVKPDDTPSLEQ